MVVNFLISIKTCVTHPWGSWGGALRHSCSLLACGAQGLVYEGLCSFSSRGRLGNGRAGF